MAEIDAEAAVGDEYAAMLREECENDEWVEVVPFTRYYPHYQTSPIAAYLIPRHLPDGSSLLIEDSIEDVVGTTWNQGDGYRASAIPGKLAGRYVAASGGLLGEVSRLLNDAAERAILSGSERITLIELEHAAHASA